MFLLALPDLDGYPELEGGLGLRGRDQPKTWNADRKVWQEWKPTGSCTGRQERNDKRKGRPGISNTRLDNKTDIDARMENGMGNPGSPMRKTWKTPLNVAFEGFALLGILHSVFHSDFGFHVQCCFPFLFRPPSQFSMELETKSEFQIQSKTELEMDTKSRWNLKFRPDSERKNHLEKKVDPEWKPVSITVGSRPFLTLHRGKLVIVLGPIHNSILTLLHRMTCTKISKLLAAEVLRVLHGSPILRGHMEP